MIAARGQRSARARGPRVGPASALALVALACACSGPSGAPDAPAAEPAAPWRVRAPGGLTPIAPGTDDPALLSAGACADCHEAEHRDWLTSRHARAWTNDIFQREYRFRPRDWCVHCHAPLAPQVAQARSGSGALADQGVNCAGCHVRGGRIVAAARRPDSPHDTVVAADFGSPAFCADCHEFSFPVFGDGGAVERSSSHPMQATVSQFLAARRAGRLPDGLPAPASAAGATSAQPDCRSCHAQGASGHAYRGAHDPAMLTRALGFAVCRDRDSAVIAVSNRGAGHNVPTGDIHRHITVRAWRASAPERLFDAFIGRRFTPDPAGGKRTTWDSTVAPGERREYRVALAEFGGTPDEPISFELRYVYLRDEHPRWPPDEPAYRVVAETRVRAEELDPCPP